ncbi:MAG: Type secretion system protein precursor [Verrucomicrobiota bacterium]|jgi:prepilin-type N-terminal cleavage/methylation domain-containing protein
MSTSNGRAAKSPLGTQRRSFTLVELLIVVIIVLILASLLFPAWSKTRQAAKNVICKSNLRQLSIGYELLAKGGYDANRNGQMDSLSGITLFWSITDMQRGDILPQGWFIGMNEVLQIGRQDRRMTTGGKIYCCPMIKTAAAFDMDGIAYNPNIHGSRTGYNGSSLKRDAIERPSESIFMIEGAQTRAQPSTYYGFVPNSASNYALVDRFISDRHYPQASGLMNFSRWDGSLGELPLATIKGQDETLLKLK